MTDGCVYVVVCITGRVDRDELMGDVGVRGVEIYFLHSTIKLCWICHFNTTLPVRRIAIYLTSFKIFDFLSAALVVQ